MPPNPPSARVAPPANKLAPAVGMTPPARARELPASVSSSRGSVEGGAALESRSGVEGCGRGGVEGRWRLAEERYMPLHAVTWRHAEER